jgi:hypothetical protein
MIVGGAGLSGLLDEHQYRIAELETDRAVLGRSLSALLPGPALGAEALDATSPAAADEAEPEPEVGAGGGASVAAAEAAAEVERLKEAVAQLRANESQLLTAWEAEAGQRRYGRPARARALL